MWSSVAVPLTSWRRAQKPPVMRTSSRPRGRRRPDAGTTGVAGVVVEIIVIP